MLRVILLSTGFLLFLMQEYVISLPTAWQLAFFLVGIVLLGVPHGAADMLVGMNNAKAVGRSFSIRNFLFRYLASLVLFGLLLWQFPTLGLLIFIFIAAYHFGETDLSEMDTSMLSGRILVTSYGLAILGAMLISHMEEVRPLIAISGNDRLMNGLIPWLKNHQTGVLTLVIGQFFLLLIAYSLLYPGRTVVRFNKSNFLRLIVILVILFRLPLLLGFTYYFVIWHSVLSIQNIVHYLCKVNGTTWQAVLREISAYSLLALSGIFLVGFSGYMFADTHSLIWYTLMALAVLTAPHMEVMHSMYGRLRSVQ